MFFTGIPMVVTQPFHTTAALDISRPLLRSILKEINVSIEEFGEFIKQI